MISSDLTEAKLRLGHADNTLAPFLLFHPPYQAPLPLKAQILLVMKTTPSPSLLSPGFVETPRLGAGRNHTIRSWFQADIGLSGL